MNEPSFAAVFEKLSRDGHFEKTANGRVRAKPQVLSSFMLTRLTFKRCFLSTIISYAENNRNRYIHLGRAVQFSTTSACGLCDPYMVNKEVSQIGWNVNLPPSHPLSLPGPGLDGSEDSEHVVAYPEALHRRPLSLGSRNQFSAYPLLGEKRRVGLYRPIPAPSV